MKKQNLLVLFAALMIFVVGCDKEESAVVTPTPVAINEAAEMAKYVESNNDYIYAGSSFVLSATTYRTEVVADPTKIYTIDLRSSTDYTAKHLKGAVNVTLANLYTHIKGLTFANYKYIVVTCYSGQTAAFGVSVVRSLLPLADANKVVSLKWGMSSIDSVFATSFWLAKTSNSRSTQFVTTDAPAKPTKGELPTLTTGLTTGKAILEARAAKVLTDGFNITITEATLYTNLSNYFIVNYWPNAAYKDPGHIEGAYNYEPAAKPFKLDSLVKTLPINKPVVVYCYTGQTSAYVGAYLKMLGYDVKSISYGANSMIFDKMKASANTSANAFVPANEIKSYKDLLE
ncbi:MAG: rhodanese-like domain-containing protein [Bacteroidetes bacterium]|nr:rhodanese-like domain-containing protein [Bacteroidota bacterium]